jgi:glycerol-3-phosphate acyltransferase PlsY
MLTSEPTDETLKLLQDGLGNITDDLIKEFNHRTVGMVIGNDQWLLLDPRTKLSTNWDIYVAILLITVIFTMPLSMAFIHAQQSLVWLDLLADVTFILDIIKVRRNIKRILEYTLQTCC